MLPVRSQSAVETRFLVGSWSDVTVKDLAEAAFLLVRSQSACTAERRVNSPKAPYTCAMAPVAPRHDPMSQLDGSANQSHRDSELH
jgi:hypothetical protein